MSSKAVKVHNDQQNVQNKFQNRLDAISSKRNENEAPTVLGLLAQLHWHCGTMSAQFSATSLEFCLATQRIFLGTNNNCYSFQNVATPLKLSLGPQNLQDNQQAKPANIHSVRC
jgi:hypothetical protein